MSATTMTPADAYQVIATILQRTKDHQDNAPQAAWADIDWGNLDCSYAASSEPAADLVGPECPWASNLFTPAAARAVLRIGAAINRTAPDVVLDWFAYELSRCGKPVAAYNATLAVYGGAWLCDPRNLLLAGADSAEVYTVAAALLGTE